MAYFLDTQEQLRWFDAGTPEVFFEGMKRLSEKEAEALRNPHELMTVEKLKEAVTSCRWGVETGGITLPSGVRVATGIDDQNRITSVVANAERSGLAEFDFKAASGWVLVTLAELQGIATAIAQHVQACFSAERLHHEAIDALADFHADDAGALQDALNSYDESAGWPETTVAGAA